MEGHVMRILSWPQLRFVAPSTQSEWLVINRHLHFSDFSTIIEYCLLFVSFSFQLLNHIQSPCGKSNAFPFFSAPRCHVRCMAAMRLQLHFAALLSVLTGAPRWVNKHDLHSYTNQQNWVYHGIPKMMWNDGVRDFPCALLTSRKWRP